MIKLKNLPDLSFKGSLLLLLIGLSVAFPLLGSEKGVPPNFSQNLKTEVSSQALGTISGSGLILRGALKLKISLEQKSIEVFAGDRVLLVKNEVCNFSYPDGRKVKFAGEGEYIPGVNEIKIIRGGMTLSFSTSTKGYKILLPTATLGIRGTIISLLVNKGCDEVWVEEGKIEWRDKNSGANGFLKTGEGLKFGLAKPIAIKKSPVPSFPKELIHDPKADEGTLSPNMKDQTPVFSTPVIKDPFSGEEIKISK